MMMFRLQTGIRAALIMMAAVASGPTLAGDRDHDDARRAVEAGEIRPLAEILDAVRDRLPGEIVRVKIEREKGHWVYEFRVIDGKGQLFEVYVDARDGAISRVRSR
jgi:uncharacterized membrane protein YkoI